MSESAFAYVHVHKGHDGDWYYTATYRNGEPGPRSEGYSGGFEAACEAARRDFPGVELHIDDDVTGAPEE